MKETDEETMKEIDEETEENTENTEYTDKEIERRQRIREDISSTLLVLCYFQLFLDIKYVETKMKQKKKEKKMK